MLRLIFDRGEAKIYDRFTKDLTSLNAKHLLLKSPPQHSSSSSTAPCKRSSGYPCHHQASHDCDKDTHQGSGKHIFGFGGLLLPKPND